MAGGEGGFGGTWAKGARVGLVVAVVLILLVAVGTTLTERSRPPATTPGGPLHTQAQYCSGHQWNTTHLQVYTTGCSALFWVFYEQTVGLYNVSNPAAQYNITFSVPWVAEVTPAGQIVRIANPMDPSWGTAYATQARGEINVTTVMVVNVTNASGSWTPDAADNATGPQLLNLVDAGRTVASVRAQNGSGATWNVSNQSVGAANLSFVFHLTNGTGSTNASSNATAAVKVDFGMNYWPWAAPTDRLAFALVSEAAFGSHLVFDPSTATLDQLWNSTNAVFVSLVFGGSANVSYPSLARGTAAVVAQAGVYPWGEVQRAFVLATFEDVSGGYASVRYDPWVVFSPSGPTHGSPASRSPDSALLVAVAVVAASAGMAGITFRVARDQRLRREGTALLREMRAAIESAPSEPRRPR